MKYFIVLGRIDGDGEDGAFVFHCADQDAALDCMREVMRREQLDRLEDDIGGFEDDDEAEELRKSGEAKLEDRYPVYITYVIDCGEHKPQIVHSPW